MVDCVKKVEELAIYEQVTLTTRRMRTRCENIRALHKVFNLLHSYRPSIMMRKYLKSFSYLKLYRTQHKQFKTNLQV